LNNVADTKVQVWGVERVIHVQGQRIRGQDNVVNDLLPKYMPCGIVEFVVGASWDS